MSSGTEARLLHCLADQQNDSYDHDEYHAAAEVLEAGLDTYYVQRWVRGLRNRKPVRVEDTGLRAQMEMLANWLGARPEAQNVFDYTGETETWIDTPVEDLADALLAPDGPLAAHDREVRAAAIAPVENVLRTLDFEARQHSTVPYTRGQRDMADNVANALRAALSAAPSDDTKEQ